VIESIRPVLRPLYVILAEGFFLFRTWGLHPLHPDHGRVALRRAALRGGVRI
jgi:hypothetical protein